MSEKILSIGEGMVGVTFNPSEDPRVVDIKQRAADLIDCIIRAHEGDEFTHNSLADKLIEESLIQILHAQSDAVRVLFLDRRYR